MYLPLAERLLQKYIEDKRIETEAGMQQSFNPLLPPPSVHSLIISTRGSFVPYRVGACRENRKAIGSYEVGNWLVRRVCM